MIPAFLIPLFTFAALPAAAPASVPTAEAVRTGSPIRCDGFLDEPSWQTAPVIDSFTQRFPDEGLPATQRTEVRFLYDDEALYMGAVCFDEQPDRIVTRLGRRDQWIIKETDWIHLTLDSNHDRQTAYSFFITAGGTVIDGVYFNDDWETYTWDGVFESQTRVGEQGWTAEVRIPFHNFRFTGADSTWGLQIDRYTSRLKENSFWVPLGVQDEGFVSRFGDLRGIRDVSPETALEVRPHLVGRSIFSPPTPVDPDGRGYLGNLGADVRYGLTSNISLHGTANPDFGQVEADPAVLNLGVFETFYEERRPFFSKDAQVFDTPFDLFYSRRIGRPPSRFPIPAGAEEIDRPDFTTILEASKVTGRTSGGTTFGLLQALTSGEEARVRDPGESGSRRHLVEPRTHYGVARLKRDLLAGNSHVGGIVTAVNRSRGGSAYAGGADWNLNWSDNRWQLRGQLASSRTRDDGQGAAFQADFGKRGGALEGGLSYSTLSPRFSANDLGFIRRSDFHRVGSWVEFQGYRPKGILRRRFLGFNGGYRWNYDGLELEKEIDVYTFLETTYYWWLGFGYTHGFPVFDDLGTRGGPPILRPRDNSFWIDVETDDQRTLIAEADFSWAGNSAGSRWRSLEVDLRWRAGDRLSVRMGPEFRWNEDNGQWLANLDEDGDGAPDRFIYGELESRVIEWTTRFDLLFSPDVSLQLYMQPFAAAGDYGAIKELTAPESYGFSPYGEYGSNPDFRRRSLRSNLVFRWEYAPGSTLFLVWAQSRSAFDDDPRLGAGDLASSFTDDGDNIWLAKVNYWLRL